MSETDTGSSFVAVERVSPTLQVRDQLLAAIRRKDYPPGTFLPSERKLGEAFGVSRVSIREALAGLEATGLIEIQHGKGARVREGISSAYAGAFALYLEMHRDELSELLDVRGALDGLAAERAASGTKDDARAAIERAHSEFAEAVDSAVDPAELALLDVAFHRSIAEASGGVLLPGLLADLNGLLTQSRDILFSQPGQLPNSVAGHKAIIDAILSGDSAAAHDAAVRHVMGMLNWVESFRSVGMS
ncbi:FadR family transcriptional regulator [Arthrobacter sp. AK01]|uniref:FadR/GntR family transcriptional regulator n=1 Tax=Micrococcaceae TaxID=1268 RepID=UPI001E47B1A7|nr:MULTISPECIES: FadR/GntR family transcriptional regulator [Micrococcaceae]MCD4853429.1 FadR family transcriptional regulator [Arthrobacter sp. AK01]MCP1413767.1 DNA-binding FadR family transcriptional regulator [Paenarthrobacter sp. A20]